MTLAACWEAANPEFPPEVRQTLQSAGDPKLTRLRLLAAIPEYQVDLPGGETASQTDLLVLATNQEGLVVIAIEGKVDEEFGPTLGTKRKNPSPGQKSRLDFLHGTLGLTAPAPDSIRYQLLHRASSAALVAQDFHAQTAVMLVHSFSATHRWYDDFAAFQALLAEPVDRGRVARARTISQPSLSLGWCSGDLSFTKVDVTSAS